MSRKAKYVIPSTPPAPGASPIHSVEIENFAKRLQQIMLDKRMSQSDVARRIWGTSIDKRGFEVAKNRDRISVYLKGKTLPDPVNMARLADALGVTVPELAPNLAETATQRENPEVQMTVIGGNSEKVLLRVNKFVPMAVAAKIITILSEIKSS